MTNESAPSQPVELLKAAVKAAVAHARAMQWEPFFETYATLFLHPVFGQNRPDDQRQALRLMIKTKGVPAPTSSQGVAAYQAAWYPLNTLVTSLKDPHDFELLGLVHLRLSDEAGARKIFQEGLALAEARDDSELCGELLKQLSFL